MILLFIYDTSDYKTEINGIKNDYVTKTSLTSQLDNLKTTHIAEEVKNVDDKATKNSSDIFNFKSTIEHSKNVINDLEREASFNRENYYYNQQSYFLYEAAQYSFKKNSSDNGMTHWKSSGIDNYSVRADLKGVVNSSSKYPKYINEGRIWEYSIEII